jgi:hypothetical protein
VSELDSFIVVGGVAKADGYNATAAAPLQWLLRPDDIAFLLDEDFRQRQAAVKAKARPSRRSRGSQRGRGESAASSGQMAFGR